MFEAGILVEHHPLHFFWFGFTSSLATFIAGPVGASMAQRHVREWWNEQFYTTWEGVRHEINYDLFTDHDREILRSIGFTYRDFEMIGQAVNRPDNPNSGSSTPDLPSGDGVMSEPRQELRYYFELSYFVNDINREHVEVLAIYGRGDTLRHTYTYGYGRLTDERLLVGSNTMVTDTFLYDGRNSVIGLTCENGNVLQRYRYDPFGQMTKGRPTQGTIFGFNGESYNADIGYQFLRARYYGVEFGRFLTRDTFLGSEEDPLSLNRYSFVQNNPNYIDPSGHFPVSIGMGSNLSSTEWARIHQRLIHLGYRGVNNTPLQVRAGPNQHTEQAVRRFRRVNSLAATTVLRNGDATWRRLFGNARPAPLIAPDWQNVHNRLRNLGYRSQNGSALAVVGSRTHNTNHALAHFRRVNGLNATTNFNRLDATWSRLFGNNARRAPVQATASSSGGTTAPRQPTRQQSVPVRAPLPKGPPILTRSQTTPTTRSNNRQTTNERNSNNAQNQTPHRCPLIAENWDECRNHIFIGGAWVHRSALGNLDSVDMSIGIAPVMPGTAGLERLIGALSVALLGLFVIDNADTITRDASNAFNWDQGTRTRFGTLLRSTIMSTTVTQVTTTIEDTMRREGVGNCDRAAERVRMQLMVMRMNGETITLSWAPASRYIWSDIRGISVGNNGFHTGISFQGLTYCVVHPTGLPEPAWINDFHALGVKSITRIPF